MFCFSSDQKIDKDTTCSAVGCPGTDLKNLNTYFSEYVLEESNASNYFNVYVAGFTFAPKVPPVSMPTNNTNSSGMGPVNKGQNAVTTVWYSNEVINTVRTLLIVLDADSESVTLFKGDASNPRHPHP